MKSLELVALTDHMEWADALLWQALRSHEPVRDDGRVRDLMVHVHSVQAVYLQLCRGEPIAPRPPSDFPTLAAAYAFARETHAGWRQWLVRRPDTGQRIHFPWVEILETHYGVARDASVSEALLQVASHSTYHRGQVNARLRELGGEPPLVDFIAWVWSGRPAAEWPD